MHLRLSGPVGRSKCPPTPLLYLRLASRARQGSCRRNPDSCLVKPVPQVPQTHRESTVRHETFASSVLRCSGLFQSEAGKAECVSCDVLGDFYSDSSGATACTKCALNTQRFIGHLDATTRDACICKEGYFHPNGSAGEPCEPCKKGYECKGGSASPKKLDPNILQLLILLPMSGAWEEGRTVIGAVSLAIEAVASNSLLLPNRTIEYVWKDSKWCVFSLLFPSISEGDASS